MSTVFLLVSAVYYLLSVSYLVITYSKYKICPEFVWGVLQLVMFYGIGKKINYQYESDLVLVCLYLLALFCFVISSSFANHIYHPNSSLLKEPNISNYSIRFPYIWMILGVSFLICGLYFIRGGGNVFIASIRAMITGTEYSTKYGRMGLLHTSGTGYVYQLRIAIIPSLTLYYIFVKKRHIYSYILAILAVIFRLGTGQRGGFISFMCVCVLAVYYWQIATEERLVEERKRSSAKTYIIIFATAMSLFALTTIMNGRVESSGSIISAMLKRIFNDNQVSAIHAFRYVYDEPCQYGRDWYLMLRKLLPGAPSYTPLAVKVFALIYGGSTAGTSPPCIWTSAYYNFGVFGVVLVSSVLGIVTVKLHRKYTRKELDELSTILYAGKTFLLCYWLVDGPVTLVNNGFVALCLLEYVMNKIAFKVRIRLGSVKRKTI